MRARLTDVARHPSWIAEWWIDLPLRRHWFWRELLLDEGRGWLRWGIGEHLEWNYEDPPESYPVAPPLRRFAIGLRYLGHQVTGYRKADWNHEAFDWDLHPWWSREWSRPEWPWTYTRYLVDPDRRRLWR